MNTLANWFKTPLGSSVSQAEQQLLKAHLQNLFGYHLLLVGAGETQWLDESRIPHRILIPADHESEQDNISHDGGSFVRASGSHLPIETDSIDTVILQHALDFSDNPHQVLREAERVLVPEGRILVCGFNALSAWGLSRTLHLWQDKVPWNGKFHRTTRLKDWLSLLGFELEAHQKVFFRPPIQSEKILDKLEFMEKMFAKIMPFSGAIYLLVAKKKISKLIPIKPRWQSRRNTVSGWVDNASRSKP